MSTIVIKMVAYNSLPYIFRCNTNCKGACCDTNMLVFLKQCWNRHTNETVEYQTLCQLHATMQQVFENEEEKRYNFKSLHSFFKESFVISNMPSRSSTPLGRPIFAIVQEYFGWQVQNGYVCAKWHAPFGASWNISKPAQSVSQKSLNEQSI